MRVYRYALAQTLRLLLWPLLGSLGLAFVCLLGLPPIEGAGVDQAVGLWLHLPAFLMAAACLMATLESWPLFSRERPGQGWIRRLVQSSLEGCGAAAAGSLSALALVLVLAGLGFGVLLSALGHGRGELQVSISYEVQEESPVLSLRQPRLHLASPPGEAARPVRALRLQPQGQVTGKPPGPARIRVMDGEEPLHKAAWLSTMGGRLVLDLEPARALGKLSILMNEESPISLRFGEGSVLALVPLGWGGWGELCNCLLACLSYLLPVWVALAILAAGRAQLSLPVAFTLGFFVLLLGTVMDLTPNAAAVSAYARGHWVGTEGLELPILGCLLLGGLVMLMASLTGKILRP